MRVDAIEWVGTGLEQAAHGVGLVAVDGEVQGLVLVVGGSVLRRQLRRVGEDFVHRVAVACFGGATELGYGGFAHCGGHGRSLFE